MVESTLSAFGQTDPSRRGSSGAARAWSGAPARNTAMSLISNSLLAVSMSTDAFAAAIGKGVAMKKPRLLEAMRIGAIFGLVETVAPVAGWLIGLAAASIVEAVDHWIAFAILGIVGARMILHSFDKTEAAPVRTHKWHVLVLTAIGTSIDAMAVGATLAFIDASIWTAAGMIGCATFVMATLGIMAGHQMGLRAGRIAEALGGVTLIAIGTKILVQHLGGWG